MHRASRLPWQLSLLQELGSQWLQVFLRSTQCDSCVPPQLHQECQTTLLSPPPGPKNWHWRQVPTCVPTLPLLAPSRFLPPLLPGLCTWAVTGLADPPTQRELWGLRVGGRQQPEPRRAVGAGIAALTAREFCAQGPSLTLLLNSQSPWSTEEGSGSWKGREAGAAAHCAEHTDTLEPSPGGQKQPPHISQRHCWPGLEEACGLMGKKLGSKQADLCTTGRRPGSQRK